MKLSEYILNYRKDHGMSQDDFGKLTGFSRAYISILERGLNPTTGKPVSPTIDTYKKIAQATNIDLDALLRTLDKNQPITVTTQSTGIKIPVLGKVVAGIPVEAITDILDYEEITPDLANTGNFFALRVKGKSMEPKIYSGDTVIVKQQSCVESGDVAIVLINGDEATVKQIKLNDSGITLIGYNVAVYEPHFYSNKDISLLPIQILGKVVELRRKF